MSRHYSTDVLVRCLCDECQGAQVAVSARKLKYLERLPAEAQDLAVHRLVSMAVADSSAR